MKGSTPISNGTEAANTGKATRANIRTMESAGTIRVPNRNRDIRDIFTSTYKLSVQSVLRQRPDESEGSLHG